MKNENIIEIPPNLTDDEIRDLGNKNAWNGTYLTQICRKCGACLCDPDGRTETATIVDQCRECFE